MRQDRILAAVNAGHPEAWSCWLTRRLVLALLERAGSFLATTSVLAQRTSTELRGELVAFERDAAIADTAKAMRNTPADVLKTSATAAELVQRLTFRQQGQGFRVELRGDAGGGAEAALTRAEFQRILQMLQGEAAKAHWLVAPAALAEKATTEETGRKPFRH